MKTPRLRRAPCASPSSAGPTWASPTLLNALVGTERAIVSPIAGTTRDSVDESIQVDGREYVFVDTAGIRRKGKTELMAEKLSVVMARRHIRMAHVALLVIDATEGPVASDATIGGYAHEEGRALVICVNKWDLLPQAKRKEHEQNIRDQFKFLEYAPIVFLSAKQGRGTKALLKQIAHVYESFDKRVTTGELNRFVDELKLERDRRIFFMTQPSVRPPTFVLFMDRAEKAALLNRAPDHQPHPREVQIRRHADCDQGKGAALAPARHDELQLRPGTRTQLPLQSGIAQPGGGIKQGGARRLVEHNPVDIGPLRVLIARVGRLRGQFGDVPPEACRGGTGGALRPLRATSPAARAAALKITLLQSSRHSGRAGSAFGSAASCGASSSALLAMPAQRRREPPLSSEPRSSTWRVRSASAPVTAAICSSSSSSGSCSTTTGGERDIARGFTGDAHLDGRWQGHDLQCSAPRTIRSVDPLEQVKRELARYEHLLLDFDADYDARGEVELVIRLKAEVPGVHTYRAPIHARDIAHPQFEWSFQRHLYDCLHDYLCEMFTRNPQQRDAQ